MSELDQSYVKKGMSEPRDGLRDQGVVSAGLAQKFEAELVASGWSSEATAEISSLTEALGTQVAEQAEAKISAKGATASERNAKARAKEIIGKVRLAASLVLEDGPISNVTEESFKAGGPLGRSTPKIAMYLEKILPPVTALDEELKPYFGGQSAAALVADARKALDAAQSHQEVSAAVTPLETQKIYETKGRLLSKIEALNKVAKIAFWGRSDIISQFNKDILNRSRSSRNPAPAPTAE